ncbi:Lysosomal thioesterase ppt2, partial [Globisporangium splendens]
MAAALRKSTAISERHTSCPKLQLGLAAARFDTHGNNPAGIFLPRREACGQVTEVLQWRVLDARALNGQVHLAIDEIQSIASNDSRFDNRYVFIAHSQGGTIARAVIAEMDDHRVKTFLSLTGVVNGLFFDPQQADVQSTHDFTVGFGSILGPPSVWNMSAYTWPSDFRGKYQHDFDEFVHLYPDLQNVYTNSNVQRSPAHDQWLIYNTFFSTVDNIIAYEADNLGCTVNQQHHCANYLKLENAHCFASSADAVLMSWQTSTLSQYSTVSTAEEIETDFESIHILDIKDATEYQQDTCGLKTLDARGGLFLHTVANAAHNCLVADAGGCSFQTLYGENIYPNLAADGRL